METSQPGETFPKTTKVKFRVLDFVKPWSRNPWCFFLGGKILQDFSHQQLFLLATGFGDDPTLMKQMQKELIRRSLSTLVFAMDWGKRGWMVRCCRWFEWKCYKLQQKLRCAYRIFACVLGVCMCVVDMKPSLMNWNNQLNQVWLVAAVLCLKMHRVFSKTCSHRKRNTFRNKNWDDPKNSLLSVWVI